jgi:hypothetical protein
LSAAKCGEVVHASLTHHPLRPDPFTFSHRVLPFGPCASPHCWQLTPMAEPFGATPEYADAPVGAFRILTASTTEYDAADAEGTPMPNPANAVTNATATFVAVPILATARCIVVSSLWSLVATSCSNSCTDSKK